MSTSDTLGLLQDLVGRARAAGADAADAVQVDSVALSAGVRLGRLERLERSESGDLGLRVLIGRRQAMVSSSDRSPAALSELVERAVAMARVVPEDPYAGLADPVELATDLPDLDTCDAEEPAAGTLLEMVGRAEDAARAVPGQSRPNSSVAGQDQDLDAASAQERRRLQRIADDGLRRFGAIGQAGRVSQIQQRFGREAAMQRRRHRQAADAGIEDADGKIVLRRL